MANPTTNFGWVMPTATSLVTNLPADFNTFGQAVDTSLQYLLGGTTGQVLSKTSGTNMAFSWVTPQVGDITAVNAGTGISGGGTTGDVTITNSMATAMTTSGDLIQATGSGTFARLGTGTSGQYLTTNGTTNSWGSISGIPTTWTLRYGTTTSLNTGAYNGSNLYVVGGTAGFLATSPDGITWTSRTSGFGANSIFSVAFGNGLWVAVGDNGTLSTSTDGTTWTVRTSNFGASDQINHVIYANSTWVAVGRGGGATNTGGIIYSTDGTTWTRKSQTPTIGTTYAMVSWNGTNFVIAAQNSTNNYLYASTPSGTWTAGADGSATSLYYITWDGTRHIVATTTGVLRFSTSTTLGTTTASSNITALNSNSETDAKNRNFYYNGRIYSTVAAGTMTDFSTTPIQSTFFVTGSKSLAPGATGFQNATILYVGSVGQILLAGNAIYTSF